MAEEKRRPELVRDTLWLTCADILTIIGGLLGQVILTRALLSEKYGLFIVLIDAFALMFILIDAGLPTIITRDVPRSRGQAKALVHRTLKIQAVIAAAFLPLGLVAGFLIWADIPVLLLLSCALIPILHIFTYAHRSALRALGEARQEAVVKIIERVVVTCGYGFLLWKGVSDPSMYALAFLSGVASSLLWAVWQGEKATSRALGEIGEDVLLEPRQLLYSALPFAITLGIIPLIGRLEKVLLAAFDSYSSAALFHIAYLAYLAGLTLPQAMRAAFLPVLGEARGDKMAIIFQVRRARRWSIALVPPGMILGSACVYLLLPLAFPAEYNDGSLGMSVFEVFLLLLSGWAFTMLAAPTYVEVCAGERPWMFTLMLAEAATIAIITALLAIPAWGVMGAIISSIVAALALLLSSFWHSQTGLDQQTGRWYLSIIGLLAAVIIPYLGLIGMIPITPAILTGIVLSFSPWLLRQPSTEAISEAE